MVAIPLNIIIVGAGVGGLTAACTLRRAGHKVTVYEKSSLRKESGQGITIGASGSRVLRDLGINPKTARLVEYQGVHVCHAETMEHMMPPVDLTGDKTKHGVPMYTAWRSDLHAALVELATNTEGDGFPVRLIVGTPVCSFNADLGSVTFADGTSSHADLIVAADGVHSNAAAVVAGDKGVSPLDITRTAAYRFAIPTETLLQDSELEMLLKAGENQGSFYVSADGNKWLVRYPCRDNTLQHFTLLSINSTLPDETNDDTATHSLRSQHDRQNLIEEMHGFHPTLHKLVQKADDVLPRWRCVTRYPLSRLQSKKLVVIGDAAHPILPRAGMGAVSAIEDAAMLGALLDCRSTARRVEPTLLEQRLETFESLRIPRIAAYKYYSEVPFFRKAVSEQREKVDVFMDRKEQPQTDAELKDWFSSYDAAQAARDALKNTIVTNDE